MHAANLPRVPFQSMRRWLDLSPDAKHLLMGMLAYDPARRLTIQQVRLCTHPSVRVQ